MLSLWLRLVGGKGDSPSRARRHEAALWLAGIELCAGVISLLTITIGLHGSPSFAIYWYLTAAITGLGLVTLIGGRWLPYWSLSIQLAIANMTISYAIYVSDRTDPAVICVVYYGWAVLYAFSFLRVRYAVMQCVLAVVGFAVAVSYGPGFTAPFGDVLFVAGSVLSTAVFVLRLVRKLSKLSHEDQLTGLPNRRFLEEHLGLTETSARSKGRIFAAAIIDLDDFKRLNDTFGHIHGDRTLRDLAERWRPLLRKGDVLARWGGDEFLLIMEDCTESEVRMILQRLFECAKNTLTISVGYGVRESGESVDDLFLRCDKALYRAKARLIVESVDDALVFCSRESL